MIFDPHIPSVLPSVYRCDDPLLVMLVGSGAITSVYEWDADAAAYLTAGEALDGQSLEPAVARAMNEWLFIAPKNTPAPIAATNWEAELAGTALNMSGWRTLAAALLPKHSSMPTPTNFNFVQGDYSRTGGLKGDGSTKYFDLNLLDSALPQDDASCGVMLSEYDTRSALAFYIGAGGNQTGSLHIYTPSGGNYTVRNQCNIPVTTAVPRSTVGLIATSRDSSASFICRGGGSQESFNQTSQPATNLSFHLFQSNGFPNKTTARIPFAFAGRAIDLTAMDSHLTSYMAALAAALA
jgi:hypothetical protein